MKPTKHQRSLARSAAQVFGIPSRELTDKRVIELAEAVQGFFSRLLERERREKAAKS